VLQQRVLTPLAGVAFYLALFPWFLMSCAIVSAPWWMMRWINWRNKGTRNSSSGIRPTGCLPRAGICGWRPIHGNR